MIRSPSGRTRPPKRSVLDAPSMARSRQSTRQVTPSWRATTAAWAVRAPVAVRKPWHTWRGRQCRRSMPPGVPARPARPPRGAARRSRRSGRRAPRPRRCSPGWRVAIGRTSMSGLSLTRRISSRSKSDRRSRAVVWSMIPSSTRSQAICSAAQAAGLAARVCSIQSLASSTVNSKSCTSPKLSSSVRRTRCSSCANPGIASTRRSGSSGAVTARHHVLSLAVEEEVDVEPVLATGGVTGEPHPGARRAPGVAEHHGLHGHRRPPQVGKVAEAPVLDGSRGVPRPQHRLHRAEQLIHGLLRERTTHLDPIDLLVTGDQLAQCGNVELADDGCPLSAQEVVEHCLERCGSAALHDERRTTG